MSSTWFVRISLPSSAIRKCAFSRCCIDLHGTEMPFNKVCHFLQVLAKPSTGWDTLGMYVDDIFFKLLYLVMPVTKTEIIEQL